MHEIRNDWEALSKIYWKITQTIPIPKTQFQIFMSMCCVLNQIIFSQEKLLKSSLFLNSEIRHTVKIR